MHIYYYFSAICFGRTIRPSSLEDTGTKRKKKLCYRGSLPFTFNV